MRDDLWEVRRSMRTTLDIDIDVLQAAKELAGARGQTTGQVVSELARKGLVSPEPASRVRNGVPLLPRRRPGSPPLTMQLVNELRDED
jgi:hypothetical protein